MQASATKAGVDLVAIALACRFKQASAISRIEETADLRALLHAGDGPILISARIRDEDGRACCHYATAMRSSSGLSKR